MSLIIVAETSQSDLADVGPTSSDPPVPKKLKSTGRRSPKKRRRGRRRESWTEKARRHGVSTRTLDRWADKGIIAPPTYINGRKYGDPDEQPRTDAAA